MRFQLFEDEENDHIKKQGQSNDDQGTDPGKIDIFKIAQRKEEVRDHEGDTAGGEPFDAIRDQQDITEPGEKQSQNNSRSDTAGSRNIKADQSQQNKGLALVSKRFVLAQRGIKMNSRGDKEYY